MTPSLARRTSALILITFAATAFAGDLNPPAGPVAPTMKDLDTVEPRIAINAINTPGDADSVFTITQPGSYYLTGNITGVVGKHGIEISAGGVTLDLNGFSLTGVPGMGDFNGITLSGSHNGITIRNGSVTGFGGNGVELFPNTATGALVEGVLASGNARDGIVTGVGNIVRDCTGVANTLNGITLLADSVAIHCTAIANGGAGIVTGNPGASVIECAVRSNTTDGIRVGQGSLVERCLSMQNGADGIECSTGCTIRGNSCWTNGSAGDGAGIHLTSNDNRIEGNNCTGNDRGIDVDAAGNIIIRNTCSANTVNWDIVANNVVGPILDRSAPGSAAILGNSAPDSTGSTHPNANFTY